MKSLKVGSLCVAALCLLPSLGAAEEEGKESAATEAYISFMDQTARMGPVASWPEISCYEEHERRVKLAAEGMLVLRSQLQQVYMATRGGDFEAGLPILEEMEGFFPELNDFVWLTLKPHTGRRVHEHVNRIHCWMSNLRFALECGDRYDLTYALEHLSEHVRAYRKFYCERSKGEVTFWQRQFEGCHI